MTAPLNDTLGFVGDYNLRSIFLRSFRYEEKLDITQLFASMEVYESIYSPFMTLRIDILDSAGLLDKAKIIGDEFIELDIRDADNATGIIGENFYIYKITDRVAISDKGSTYTLHCISLPALADMNMLISKSFKGQPSEIIKEIFTNYLYSEKTLTIENTKNSIQYVSNYWSPIRNIKFLCDRSIGRETKTPAYFFFENKKEFIFCSLNALVQQDSTHDFFYTVNRKVLGDDENKMKIIEKIYVDESFDYIKRLKTGAYGNRTLVVNPFTKTYKYNYYDFIESFNDFSRLNTEPFTSVDAPRKINSLFRTRVAPDMSFSSMNSEMNAEWFAQNPTEYASIDSQKIQIDVPGRFNIYAGSVVSVFMYSDVLTSNDDLTTAMDSVLSGRYLATSLKHLFTKERHSLHMELSKDSLITKVNKS